MQPDAPTVLPPDLADHIAEIVRRENESLLRQHTTLKPLLSVPDVARTLGVSPRTVETLIASGHLRPLWIKGQRRFHPDAIDAYLRTCQKKPRSSTRRRRTTS